jgi:hypothetical protein
MYDAASGFDRLHGTELKLERRLTEETTMTRITVDASTAAKLHGLGQFLEFYDEAGNLLGHFEPDEKSPAFREWLRNLDDGLSDEEVDEMIRKGGGVTTDELLARLKGSKP